MRRFLALVLVAIAAIGCTDRATPLTTAPAAPLRSTVTSVALVPDTTNALQLLVRAVVLRADSVYVLYRVGAGDEQQTPVVAATASLTLPVLGVSPGASVSARVVALRGGVADTSGPVTTTNTAAVPDIMRRVRLVTTAGHATRGYVLTAVTLGDTSYAVAFDSTGAAAWYRAFPGLTGANDAYQQPNGDYTLFLNDPGGAAASSGYFAEVQPAGALVREWAAPTGYSTDVHEFRLRAGADGSSYLFGYDTAQMDFTARGGASDSAVAGHEIFRLNAQGAATPVFVAREHFTIADWIDPEPDVVDFDHPNSIDVDRDGGLIVSWRNFDEVSKIDPTTGQFVWRLGGPHNQFAFVNDPLGGFGGQHFARILANGDLLLYDNGTTHTPQQTRAVEYRLDLVGHTATLVWEFRHQPTIFTAFVGSAQRLASGNTFIGYGYVGVATEVTPAGGVVWEGRLTIDGTTTLAYRLLKIAALSRYSAP